MAAASNITQTSLSRACYFYKGTEQRTAIQTATGDIFFTTRLDQELPPLEQNLPTAFRLSPQFPHLYEVQLEGKKPSYFKKATTADWTQFKTNPHKFTPTESPRTTGLQRQVAEKMTAKSALETAASVQDAALMARFEKLTARPPLARGGLPASAEEDLYKRFKELKSK